ncbi:MAG: LysM domain-containing protein [Chloroflexota bacterium]
MRNTRQVLWGLGIALVSGIIILGGLALSMTEGNLIPARPTFIPTASSTITIITQEIIPPTPVPTETITLTPPPPPSDCQPPTGWLPFYTNPNDTINVLAARHQTSIEAIVQGNCLTSVSLPGSAWLFLPPLPTPTPVPCGPPQGWITYLIQPGDNLYRLSLAYGINVKDLQRANCLGNSTLINAGTLLYVPYWAPRTPSPTLTSSPTATMIVINSPTASASPLASATASPTTAPSLTPTQTETTTLTFTPTPTP